MSTADRVAEYLQTCDLRRAREPEVARALCMSGTTLRRRLKDEDTRFVDLLTAERLRRVRSMPDAGGKRLAEVCGYYELGSFYRAFKSWTGRGWLETKMQARAG